jgi:hypothetical protein
MSEASEYLSVAVAAKILRVSTNTVYAMCEGSTRGRGYSWKKKDGRVMIRLPSTEHMFTPKALAESMNYSEQYVRRLIARGVVRALSIGPSGTRKRIPLSEGVKLLTMRLSGSNPR